MVWNGSPYQVDCGLLPKFNRDFQGYICDKNFRDVSQTVETFPMLQCQRIFWKIPGYGSGSGWVPKR